MNNFDNLFFRGYIGADQEIRQVFHRHVFVILEDIALWVFFGLLIPAFLYSQDVFLFRSSIPAWYSYVYVILIYALVIYKLFDWYVDVWIGTENTIVDMRWQWFTSNLLYIPYAKIEGIQIRTRSWWAAFLGMSDVVVKLNGGDEFTLYSARNPNQIIEFLQGATKHETKHSIEEDDREPFDILVDTLSDVVKGHLTTRGKEYITREYVEKLDQTLTRGKVIDLRTPDEKVVIESWKWKYKKGNTDHEEGGHDDHASHDEHESHDDHHGGH